MHSDVEGADKALQALAVSVLEGLGSRAVDVEAEHWLDVEEVQEAHSGNSEDFAGSDRLEGGDENGRVDDDGERDGLACVCHADGDFALPMGEKAELAAKDQEQSVATVAGVGPGRRRRRLRRSPIPATRRSS
jgi:hypothetical protein